MTTLLTELLERRRTLVEELAKSKAAFDAIDFQIQDVCEHDWHWHQVAGEGRVCAKCARRDFCDD